jgi:hypothetical protein
MKVGGKMSKYSIIGCLFFFSAESFAMTPYEMNSELPYNFDKSMPFILVKCADLCASQKFSEAAALLIEFKTCFGDFFHSDFAKKGALQIEVEATLSENYSAVKNVYDDPKSPYDKKFKLSDFARSGFLGALYWDYNSMLSSITFWRDRKSVDKSCKVSDVVLRLLPSPKPKLETIEYLLKTDASLKKEGTY